MSKKKKPFFVGYLNPPKGLHNFLLITAIVLVSSFGAASILVGATQDDPGVAGFRFDFGRQTITGIIEAEPYPLIYVTEGSERIKAGRTVMLAGPGKTGIMKNIKQMEGSTIKATGIMLKRGELDMLQVGRGKNAVEPVTADTPVPESKSIGKWRLQGEICDGKCLAGAMQPGRGLAHKACAILCVIGDIPPVFVSTQPIEGQEFLLMGDINGGPLSAESYDYMAQFVEIDAEIERRGDLLVMLVDPKKIKVVE